MHSNPKRGTFLQLPFKMYARDGAGRPAGANLIYLLENIDVFYFN
jgi:hypothetical protein